MSIHHFTSHLDQIVPYTGDGSYVAKRLVLYPIGASGYAHATLLTMPPGTKVLSHWHDDREAVFYCLRGEGLFVLDDVEHAATPGTAMLQPVNAVHGFVAGATGFDFLDFALFADTGSSRDPGSCFAELANLVPLPTRYGDESPLFAGFANPAIRFVGERRIDGCFDQSDVHDGTEQIVLVLEGEGELELLGHRVPLRAGSVVYLIADLPFSIRGSLRTVASSSDAGRIPEPPLFDELRAR
ncbi:MAG: cupin domain-containing protein [Gaiellaceae bacterium]